MDSGSVTKGVAAKTFGTENLRFDMSYTTVYGIDEKGELTVVSEHRNSWRSAPMLWEYLLKSYLRENEGVRYNGEIMVMQSFNAIWKIDGYLDRLTKDEWFSVFTTFDNMIFPIELKKELCDSLRSVCEKVSAGRDYSSNFSAMADVIEKSSDYKYFAFNQTSVSECWPDVPSGDPENPDYRGYNIYKDGANVCTAYKETMRIESQDEQELRTM